MNVTRSPIRRQTFSSSLLWIALLAIVFAGYWTMRTNRNRLITAQVQLQECEKIAKDIQTLQARPGFAAFGVDSPRTITARAEEAAKQANLSPISLVRIEPQSAVRLRNSAYRLRPTRLELRRATLAQIVAFTHAMIDEAKGTTVRDLRLTASDGADGGAKGIDAWNAELVLTQLIFSPLAK